MTEAQLAAAAAILGALLLRGGQALVGIMRARHSFGLQDRRQLFEEYRVIVDRQQAEIDELREENRRLRLEMDEVRKLAQQAAANAQAKVLNEAIAGVQRIAELLAQAVARLPEATA